MATTLRVAVEIEVLEIISPADLRPGAACLDQGVTECVGMKVRFVDAAGGA